MHAEETWQIRAAEETDLDAICRIEEEAFSVPWTRADYEALLSETMAVFLVLTDTAGSGHPDPGYAGAVRGYGCIRQAADEGDLLSIAVHPESRGSGRGSGLLQALLREAERKGTRRVFLEVRKSNAAAIAMYEHAGFEKTGVRKRYYTKPEEDAWMMRWCAGEGKE